MSYDLYALHLYAHHLERQRDCMYCYPPIEPPYQVVHKITLRDRRRSG